MKKRPPVRGTPLRWRCLVVVPVCLLCGKNYADTPEPGPEGTLQRDLFGNDAGQSSGIKLDGNFQIGYVRNNSTPSDQRSAGLGNLPVAQASDEGLDFNGIDLFIHRDIGGNIVPRVTPTPAPAATTYSWGFMLESLYGRSAQSALTFGLDNRLAINHPGNTDAAAAQASRQQFLALPNVFLQFGIPWWRGMAVTLGNFGLNLGYEIPAQVRQGPDFFYSRTYAFIATPQQAVGGLLSANAYRGPYGLLLAEIGLVNGWQNLHDNNGNKTAVGSLRWRSPDLRSALNFTVMSGNEQNRPGITPQFPSSKVVSPNGQRRTFLGLNGSEQIGGYTLAAEAIWGRQEGDGAPATILLGPHGGPGFRGASYFGCNAQAMYRMSPNVSIGVRGEWFHDPAGFAVAPATNGRGNFNALTVGLHYQVNRFLRVRPEVRYDGQTSSPDGIRAYGNGAKSSQWMEAVDVLLFF